MLLDVNRAGNPTEPGRETATGAGSFRTVILSRRRRWSAKRGTPKDGRRISSYATCA